MRISSQHWFWGILARYMPLYTHVAVASFMVNALGLAMPLFVMNVYDRIVPNNAYESLWVLTAGVVLALGLDVILRTIRARFVDAAGRNADVLLLGQFMDALLDTRLDANPARSVGGLLAKVREFEHVREFLGSTTLLAVLDIPFVLLFVALIGILGGWLACIPLFAIPCMIGFAALLQWPFRQAAERQLQSNVQKHALLGEMSAGFETIRVARLENTLLARWDKVVDATAAAMAHSRSLGAMAAHSAMFISSFLSVMLVVAGVYRIAAGAMSMGALIACVILLGRCMNPLCSLVNIFNNFYKMQAALVQMRQLLDLPRENPSTSDEEIPATEIALVTQAVDIRLEDISFRYPHQDALTLALAGIHLHIARGEHIAIVGATGSGKSSLARVCAGLYHPLQGRVLLGTVDMQRVPMRAMRQGMGYLPQNIYLFSGTVRDNLRMAWPESVPFDTDQFLAAAEMAGVMDFARLHPLGLDMPVGEQGQGLSGGQAQAVALARALLGNPHTLILDEPTSNLDMGAEDRLRQRLAPFLRGRTCIILTHRLSMLSLVQRVVVLEHGHIVKDAPVQEVVRA